MHIKMETLFCVGTLDYKTFKGSYGIHVVRMDGEKGSLTHVSERNDGYNPSQFVKKLHHQAAQQPSAASKIQKYPPKACKQRRFHAQFASFFRFMAANLSLTHCVTRARPLMWV